MSAVARKVRETRHLSGGFMGERDEVRVRSLTEGEAVPEGAEIVPAETPEHDWTIVSRGGE